MPSSKRSASSKAGVSDVSDFGEKDLSGAYPPGTTFDLGEHGKVDVTKVPDIVGGKPKSKPPASRKR